ncbi:hypothetical protein BDW59DRAFT_147147 [Aspergillus cavernicola]|uniref:Zn(2)-C6 fungal-type domain-containing protein n=1 Tax=Aspergillus cavernicola TaxID=176166 RepID=A0ABR4IAN5_9EURO
MEIDPRLHSRRDNSSSEGTESASDYPEPPSQTARHQTAPNPYRTTSYPEESSSTLRTSPHTDAPDPNDPYADLKRPRACEACRQLKVRCEPDLANPDEPCKRCAKAGRSCVVTVPTRKRQKKTEGRVAELERKIEALTAQVSHSGKIDAVLPSNNSAQSSSSRDDAVGRRWLVSAQSNADQPSMPSRPGLTTQAGSKRSHSGEVKDSRDAAGSTQTHASYTSPSTERTADTPGKQWASAWSPQAPGVKEAVSKAPDIIDQGLVSLAVAMEAFTRHMDSMSGHIPMVVFPPGTQMSEVRKNKPVLFHAIIAVSVGPFQPSAQGPLLQELYKAIAERVIVKGEKSLDLVQALLVSCSFYTPPDNFEEIKFYQLAQLAVAVGMDIGMYRKSSMKPKPFSLFKEKNPPASDPDSPEARRAWLGCYFVSVQTSSALRRPILVRWLPYMDECVDILENSPDALPSDRVMIQWAKLARIIEEISARFFADDLGAGSSFSESRFQFTLKAFEKQLEQWKRAAFNNQNSAIMCQAEAIVSIYLHENAMVLENYSDDSKGADADISSPTTASRINALSSSLASIHQAIDTVCSIPATELVNIPTVALARTAFAIVALIKLYSIVTAPESYIGQVIEPSHLKVESYLDKVIAHYTAAGDLPGGVTPGKFSTVLSMLREWFRTRKDQHGVLNESLNNSQKGLISSIEPNRIRNITAQVNTPLHLLSEVATGDPKNQSRHHHQQTPYAAPRPTFPAEPISQQSPDLVQSFPACMGISPTPPSATAPPAADSDSWPHAYPSQRQFYPSPFDSNSPNQQQQVANTASGYPDFSGSTGMTLPSVFVPEMGAQLGYPETENLSAFWNMMGDVGVFYPQQGAWPF